MINKIRDPKTSEIIDAPIEFFQALDSAIELARRSALEGNKMPEPNQVICSESGVDLKDKESMGLTCDYDPSKIDEKALQEILKNTSIPSSGITTSVNMSTGISPDFNYQNYRATIGWEELGTHWVLANSITKKHIEDGNETKIINIKYGDDYLVLAKVKRTLYDDGAGEKSYYPITLSTVNRMPE